MTTTTKNPTQVVAEKGRQELFIYREFNAPRDLVFKAFSEPELLLQFFAPEGVTMQFLKADYREGGAYSYRHTGADGKVLCTFTGVIHEMTAPERIVLTSEFEELPERGHVVLEAMLFEELPGNRTRLTIHDVCRSVADRDAMVESGMEYGLVQIFDNLERMLHESKIK